jgi:hypothetical protein
MMEIEMTYLSMSRLVQKYMSKYTSLLMIPHMLPGLVAQ